MRRRRLDLSLLQRQVAERLGTGTSTITNWELGRTEPELRFLPGIVQFLGYAAWAAGPSLGGRLLACRRERGLSQAAFARQLGVDPGTVSHWERNVRIPTGRYDRLVEGVLKGIAGQPSAVERRRAHPDLDLTPERGEEGQEPIGRVAGEPAPHEAGTLG